MAEQITLTLPDTLAKQVREVAALSQRGLEEVLLEWLDLGRLQIPPQAPPETTEATLLGQINLGFSADWWRRYEALIHARQAEAIAPSDLAELIAMSEALEVANVKRIAALAELAQLRGCSLEQIMETLDIGPRKFEAEMDG